MGDIYLDLTIANIHDMERQQDVSFFVDTGSTRAWIPEEIAEQVGIEPVGTVPLELADGTIQEYQYGLCLFSFGGELIAGNVIIGLRGSEPLVGSHVLQEFRVVIDMERHAISRSRAMRAK